VPTAGWHGEEGADNRRRKMRSPRSGNLKLILYFGVWCPWFHRVRQQGKVVRCGWFFWKLRICDMLLWWWFNFLSVWLFI
jgi:hypothetical protein